MTLAQPSLVLIYYCFCRTQAEMFVVVVVVQVIPLYTPETTFQPSVIEMVEGQTSPPQLLTEADLISLMEKHGIGIILIQ